MQGFLVKNKPAEQKSGVGIEYPHNLSMRGLGSLQLPGTRIY
jgi:hypothetical protein